MPNSPRYRLERYVTSLSDEWDNFVRNSINGTFLHTREFLSYHKGRFEDFSVLVYNERNQLVGVVPLARGSGNFQVVSHPGITYGGIVHAGKINGSDMLEVVTLIRDYLLGEGFREWFYKAIPHFYHLSSADEDLYALWRLNADIHSRAAASVISPNSEVKMSNRRLRSIRKSADNIEISTNSLDYREYWFVLEENLLQRYGKVPVHSIDEILVLKNRFPENIELMTARLDNELLGGIVLFKTNKVVHLQYIATNNYGRTVSVLDKIIARIIEEYPTKYIDFGISTEQNGRILNDQLHKYKSEFGSGVICYDTYHLKISKE